ncbi:hypothetical protein LTR35_001946 [Friedmanniomyces endolithicus]|uniref:Uncharacterized protein n=1 Tax=Friedmanniomyces endolithicus TaxID=329885 RepID=A0AAN6JCU3_9PEZI|nr:hypothetical protein LTS00_011658 [Friedmanniomyces endolithicus]KAK0291223.1 hypothetical protein LTR35_001946 [Friedmanniomyces endolithicus]KAK0325250.1 hypothetical protein LTR82_003531 [Friedmanniomyces endolithicus]KAK0996895.1 hypothetical protein LTR54_009971 [Friedmanniomyces endolithicus]
MYTQKTEVVDGYTYAIGTRTYHQTTERTMSEKGTYCVPNGCTVQGGTVQLLYWPASASTPGSNQTRSHASPGVTLPTAPVTALYKNLTLTSPSVYIDFKTAFALDNCGQTVGDPHPGAIIPLNPKDLYTIDADYDWIVATSTIHNTLVTTTFYMSKTMNYHDLTGLPPGAAYEEMPLCVPVGCPVITPSLYHPQLVLPTQVRALDPAWSTCGLDWQGLWDPPIALQPAVVVDPVTTPVGPQQTVSASPASAATPETPLPTSSQASSSVPATTGPAAVGSQGATLIADPSGSSQPPPSSVGSTSATEAASRIMSLFSSDMLDSTTSVSSQLVGAVVSPLFTTAGSSPASTTAGENSISEGVGSVPAGQPSPTDAYQVFSQAHQSAASLAASPADSEVSADAASSQHSVLSAAGGDPGSINSPSVPVDPTTSIDPTAAAPEGETINLGATVYPTQSDPAPSSDPQDPATIVSPSSGQSASAEAAFTLASETLTAIALPPTNGHTGISISVASQTIAVNSGPAIFSGHTLSAAANGIVVDGTLLTFSMPTPLSSSPASEEIFALTLGGTSAITASLLPQSAVQIGTQTLLPGSSAVVIAGQTLSAVPSGLVEDGSTTLVFPPAPTQGPGVPVDPGDPTTARASSTGTPTNVWPILASRRLTPHGPALVLSGHTFTAVSDGNILEDGTLLGYTNNPTTLSSDLSSPTGADPNDASTTVTVESTAFFLPAIAFGRPTTTIPTGSSDSIATPSTAQSPSTTANLKPTGAAKANATSSTSAAAAIGRQSGFLSMAMMGCWVGVCICLRSTQWMRQAG